MSRRQQHEAVGHVGACSLSATGGSAQHQPPSQFQRPSLPRERGAPEAADPDPPLFHGHILPKERRDGDDERRGRAAVGDPPLFSRNEAPTVRIIQPNQSVSEDIRRSELAAAIARVLPKRRRGRYRRPKARPDTSRDEPPRKQIRARTRKQRRQELQAEDLASVLRFLEDEFAVKESLSNKQAWCTPIPHERKVSTVRAFYKEFHDVDTLPIRTCMLCYRQPFAIFMSELLSRGRDLLGICRVRSLLEAGYSVACGLASQTYWGLTPVEEKLIALNSCYGFVTRYSIASSQKQSARYPKHIKGHITVFPNNVQELATKVLPHPLVQVMEEIHVSWQGAEKLAPSDLSGLLSVRRRVVERALVWLKKNNPHYAEIEIDAAEMES
ncbi:uncharacterized protein NECHADRAFT_88368 [Fusarium vanettenii 77-13-4]|uniref:DUF6570 domain-containing protein n=1 Tax=Fusarium vanettenii (strain ATCC MYA-4622 / CBS 123669 / FGSC 9596 / NRRL 45880 / 77-13-4) TaxID=660122 RepID=C7ZM89_FUSV7|nr:uncharacterized protein NECHADRAFT_88368 [Fusarium vanettenii 77-13-4]EEU34873.1 predicted protein [Fusarium vanettenii 77-13-4]